MKQNWKKGGWFVRVFREEDGFGTESYGRSGALQIDDVQPVGDPALWNGQHPFWLESMLLEPATKEEIQKALEDRTVEAAMINRGERMGQVLSDGEFAADHEWIDGQWRDV
jgi:hypothetical protein